MSSSIIVLDDSSFEEIVFGSELPVLVDFWAYWCGPCTRLLPVLEKLASEYLGKLKVCKLDVDGNQATPAKYGVRGIPTLILFKDKAAQMTKTGLLSATQLKTLLEPYLL